MRLHNLNVWAEHRVYFVAILQSVVVNCIMRKQNAVEILYLLAITIRVAIPARL